MSVKIFVQALFLVFALWSSSIIHAQETVQTFYNGASCIINNEAELELISGSGRGTGFPGDHWFFGTNIVIACHFTPPPGMNMTSLSHVVYTGQKIGSGVGAVLNARICFSHLLSPAKRCGDFQITRETEPFIKFVPRPDPMPEASVGAAYLEVAFLGSPGYIFQVIPTWRTTPP